MAKKFSLLLAAVAVLAFAIPSMASATLATLPKGTTAPVGTEITGTGSDVILKSNLLGTITCATLNLNGKITTNSGGVVEGKGENANPTQSGCVNGAKAVTVTSVELSSLKSSSTQEIGKTGTGTVSFVAIVDIGTGESLTKCTFTGKEIGGTFVSGTNVLKFSEAGSVTATPAACGTSKLSGEFKLEKTSTTTELILD